VNQFGLLPNHENRHEYEGTPIQGVSKAKRAGVFLKIFQSSIRCACIPLGAAAFILPPE